MEIIRFLIKFINQSGLGYLSKHEKVDKFLPLQQILDENKQINT